MSITLDQVTKHYQGIPVVNDVSLEIGDGEFFVLLGPSGSGKSTLLRATAGLTGVDHGRIALRGRDVTHLAARRRGVGLVFQNYALFHHMTVADNIEFALRVRHMRRSERRRRRAELLRLVALEGMDERLPGQLSGGQQQRIAVARALAHQPEVLLLDEPFGALDARIREELRLTIRQVQRELGITTVLVTHDQEEAFALADRIGVMNLGRLLEVGRPDDLYARPATRFVATFLGAANLLLARLTPSGLYVGTDPVDPSLPVRAADGRDQEVVTVVRPEEIELAANRHGLRAGYLGQGLIERIAFSGALERAHVRLGDAHTVEHAARAGNGSSSGATHLEVTRTSHEQRLLPLTPGQWVAVGLRHVHVLPTPLSSFTACAPTEEAAQALGREPLLAQLAAHMKTRVTIRVQPQLADTAVGFGDVPRVSPISGAVVIAAHEGAIGDIEWLLQHGADAILLLPPAAPPPRRVLIHWIDDGARSATLAASASLLRHVSAEAAYVEIRPGAATSAQRPRSVRALLNARAEAQALHGLEMRTELRFGDTVQQLAERLGESAAQLLVLGFSEPSALAERCGGLLAPARWPVLAVYGGPRTPDSRAQRESPHDAHALHDSHALRATPTGCAQGGAAGAHSGAGAPVRVPWR